MISLPRTDRIGLRDRLLAIELRTWRPGTPYLIAGLAAVLAVQTWFEPGKFVAEGDVAPFFRTNLSAEVSSLWGHSLSGAGSVSFQSVARWPELFTLHAAGLFGASASTAQLWFFSLIALSAALASVWFVSAFVRSTVAASAAGLVAVFNPFVLQHLPNPLTLWAIAVMAAAGGLLVRASLGRYMSPLWFACLSIFFAYLAINPPLLAVLSIWISVLALTASWWAGNGATRRATLYLLRATPWALLLNLWWIFPFGLSLRSQGVGYVVQAQTNVLAWSWTQVRLSLANVASLDGHWGWPLPEYFPYSASVDDSIWGPLRFGLPALAFIAPGLAIRRRRRAAIVFAASAVALILVSKGLHSPFAGLNLSLYQHVPGMWLFREPFSKLGPIIVLLYSALVAISVEGASRLIARSNGRLRDALAVSVVVMLVGGLGFAYPMWTGQVVPDRRPLLPPAHVSVPEGWTSLADALNRSTTPGKALVLPLDDFYQVPTTWGYYGIDQIPRSLLARPTIQVLPGSYYGELPNFAAEVQGVQTALLNGDRSEIGPLLGALGVSYVIVRRDLPQGFSGRSFASPDDLESTLSRTAGLTRQGSYGVADVFAVGPGASGTSTDPTITVGSPLSVDTTDPTDTAFAVGNAPAGTTIVPTDGRPPSDASSPLTHAIVAGPASRTTRFASGAGQVELVPGLVAPQLLHVSQHAGKKGTNLVLARATTFHIDGRTVLGGPLAVMHVGSGPNVVAISSGESFAPLRGGEALLGIGSSGDLSAWSARDALPWRGSWTNLHDCHDFNASTQRQEGLSAARLPGRELGVSLEALSHTACVRAHVDTSASQSPELLRFDYRSVAGNPARICLWLSGPDSCAPTPPLDPSPGWHRYQAVIPSTPYPTTEALFLYADGDTITGMKTHSEFRGMSLKPLWKTATRVVKITLPAEQTVALRAGSHQIVTSTRAPATLGPFSFAVSDCHAFDQRTITEAGLQASALPDEPGPAARLTARSHSACVSAAVAGFVPGGSYTLDLDYRTVEGLPARVCVWEIGPDRCAPLPAVQTSADWYHLQASVSPGPDTVGLRVFLYADAGVLGDTTTVAEYRALRITPASPVALTMIDASVGAPVTPQVSWSRLGGSVYRVNVGSSSQPFVISLAESYASGWKLEGAPSVRVAGHVVSDGYANGWVIAPGSAFTATIRFSPDRAMNGARVISLLTAFAMPVAVVRRRRRRAYEGGPP